MCYHKRQMRIMPVHHNPDIQQHVLGSKLPQADSSAHVWKNHHFICWLTAAQSIQYLDKVSFNELCCWIVQPHHAGSIPPSGIPGPNTCLHQVMQQPVRLCEAVWIFQASAFLLPSVGPNYQVPNNFLARQHHTDQLFPSGMLAFVGAIKWAQVTIKYTDKLSITYRIHKWLALKKRSIA